MCWSPIMNENINMKCTYRYIIRSLFSYRNYIYDSVLALMA